MVQSLWGLTLPLSFFAILAANRPQHILKALTDNDKKGCGSYPNPSNPPCFPAMQQHKWSLHLPSLQLSLSNWMQVDRKAGLAITSEFFICFPSGYVQVKPQYFASYCKVALYIHLQHATLMCPYHCSPSFACYCLCWIEKGIFLIDLTFYLTFNCTWNPLIWKKKAAGEKLQEGV